MARLHVPCEFIHLVLLIVQMHEQVVRAVYYSKGALCITIKHFEIALG